MYAFVASHNGLGDNLSMNGGLRFLLNFYEKVFFLCKDKFYSNVILFFADVPNITCIPFDGNNETNELCRIIMENYNDPNNDIFICGNHKLFLSSKITNNDFLNYNKIVDEDYHVEHFGFIEDIYKDAKLSFTYFYEYFFIPNTQESIDLYQSVSNYYIIFIQLRSSDGYCLNISNLLEKYINDDNVLLLCNDENLYDLENEKQVKKHNLCKPFVYNKMVNYNETIKNCDEIYIINSCFSCLVLPYLKTNQLKATKVEIIPRCRKIIL